MGSVQLFPSLICNLKCSNIKVLVRVSATMGLLKKVCSVYTLYLSVPLYTTSLANAFRETYVCLLYLYTFKNEIVYSLCPLARGLILGRVFVPEPSSFAV